VYIGVRQLAFHCTRELYRIGGAVEIGLIRSRNDRSKMNDYARRRMNIRESTTDIKGRVGCMPFPIGKT